jgi:hypothetical protein
MANMRAELLLNERRVLDRKAFAELVVWRLTGQVLRSEHAFKYRLTLVVGGKCVLRYDNEAGKGDHKHFGQLEAPYTFITPARLLADFWNDVELWRSLHGQRDA